MCLVCLVLKIWHFRELSSKISQQGQSHFPHSITPLLPGKCTSGAYYFFTLPAMNGPLPAVLKDRENTVNATQNNTIKLQTALKLPQNV